VYKKKKFRNGEVRNFYIKISILRD